MRRKINVCCSVVLRCLRLGVDGEVFMSWFPVFFRWCVRLITDSVHFPDGQAEVKSVVLHEIWLRSGELYLNLGPDTLKCDRTRSKNREATSTGSSSAGEDIQNTGTFIVVRSSVFMLSSAQKTQLARDAYNALWDSRRRSQERK